MIRLGFHNPHFSTFLRASSLHNLRFDLSYGNLADIFFFLNFFQNLILKLDLLEKWHVLCPWEVFQIIIFYR